VVLLEALSHSLPVIAYARGCIASDIPHKVGLVIPVQEEFVDHALAQLRQWISDPNAYYDCANAAAQLSSKLHECAKIGYIQLVNLLTGSDIHS
jgi:hypothetical protein